MMDLVQARDLMSFPVRKVTTRTPVREAAAFLLRHKISGAPVIDDHGRLAGVFTLNDLARCVERRHVDFAKVGDAMTPFLSVVFEDASIEEVIHTMKSQKIHRVFVMSVSGELLGVITSMDILSWMERSPETSMRR